MKDYNFLIIMVDQMQSFTLGCNGDKTVKTPNIDRLASEGCTFKRAYCNNPVCMPSRSSIITGFTPRQHGCLTNGNKLPEDIPTVTRVLGEVGYKTHGIGKFHFQPFGVARTPDNPPFFSWEEARAWRNGSIESLPPDYYGFQTTEFIGGHVQGCYGDYLNWLNKTHPGVGELYHKKNAYYQDVDAPNSWRMDVPYMLHYNNWIGDRAIAYMDSLNRDDRFMLWVSFPDPHFPYAACKPYSEMYDADSIDLDNILNEPLDMIDNLRQYRLRFKNWSNFNEKGLREVIAQTYGMITHVDDNVGRILEHLKIKGLTENTVIVFMADHGEYLGSHQLLTKSQWPWESLIRVPYIWKVPDGIKYEKGSDKVVSLLDFVPTVLDLAGLGQEKFKLRGICDAMNPVLPGNSLKDYLITGKSGEESCALIEYDEDWDMDTACRMRAIVGDKFKLVAYTTENTGLLIDLEDDPLEKINLWDDPDYKDIKCRMLEKLVMELGRTDRFEQKRMTGA